MKYSHTRHARVTLFLFYFIILILYYYISLLDSISLLLYYSTQIAHPRPHFHLFSVFPKQTVPWSTLVEGG